MLVPLPGTCEDALMNKTEIKTKDGTCPSYVFRPAVSGPWPAVLVFMDGVGIRPAMLEVGERLATHGYFVLLPDLFYRSGRYEPMDPVALFTDPEKRKVLMEKFFALATSANIMSDTRAFLDYLAAQPDVKQGGIGTTGYCMGGLMSLTAAGTYPDRIVATASYHGGRLATFFGLARRAAMRSSAPAHPASNGWPGVSRSTTNGA
jgi:carboxymethylenebutenolidase